MKSVWNSKGLWIGLLVVLGLGTLAWTQRHPILAWYHVRQLTYAYEENREDLRRHVASLGECCLPRLLEGMHDGDAWFARICKPLSGCWRKPGDRATHAAST